MTSMHSSNQSAPFTRFVVRRSSRRLAIACNTGNAKRAVTTFSKTARQLRSCRARKGSEMCEARRSFRNYRASLAIRSSTRRCRLRRSKRMKRIFSFLPALLTAMLLSALTANAHHSFAMFDRTVEKVVTGTVVRWAFNNPHSWLYLNVKNKDGSETLWSFEGSSPTQLLQRGITGFTFEPNSTITVQYCPLKDGRPGGGIGWVRLANGNFISPADGGCNGSAEAIERWKVWLAKGYTSSTEAQNAK